MPEMTAKPFRRLFKPNYLMVYATLGGKMGGEIHALQLRTLTEQEAAA